MIPTRLRLRLRFLAAALVFAGGAAHGAPAKRPNIILLLPEQMRASAMGVAGNPDAQSPIIDRLAREGIRFKRTYAKPLPDATP